MRTMHVDDFPYRVELEGWAIGVRLGGAGAGPGLRNDDIVLDQSDPVLVDRDEWDAWHPGVAPSDAALAMAVDRAADRILEAACAQADQP